MQPSEILTSIVLSAHAMARLAAQETGNTAPSTQWRALSILERQGGMRLGALAQAARTTQPGMTRLIGALHDEGLVERSPDPSDSRATVVTATEAGKNAVSDWRTKVGTTIAPHLADLTADDWLTLERAAEILAAHAIENTGTPNTTGENK